MKTVIVGGGASGLACAIRLKQNNASHDVTILERLDLPGKKILATGNGRCNLSNKYADQYNVVIDFFENLGLKTRTDNEGRIYPYSLKAETVLSVLTKECEKLGVKIVTQCRVSKITNNNGYCIYAGDEVIKADNVVMCCGGGAQSALGSDGSGYKLLKSLGHSLSPLHPALVQLNSSSKYPRMLKGTRIKCKIAITLDGEEVGCEYGELLFTQYGISGIAVMNLSALVSNNFLQSSPKKCLAILDLIPEMAENEIENYVNKFGNTCGILGTAIGSVIEKQANADAKRQAHICKNWSLIITGTKGFDFAQVTNGGVPLNEVRDFESTIYKNLYICGELLDVKLPCGGYNLNFAFLSGIKAADKITEKLK